MANIQSSFIAEFAALPDQAQFYLAGGTALAQYYLGHREKAAGWQRAVMSGEHTKTIHGQIIIKLSGTASHRTIKAWFDRSYMRRFAQ